MKQWSREERGKGNEIYSCGGINEESKKEVRRENKYFRSKESRRILSLPVFSLTFSLSFLSTNFVSYLFQYLPFLSLSSLSYYFPPWITLFLSYYLLFNDSLSLSASIPHSRSISLSVCLSLTLCPSQPLFLSLLLSLSLILRRSLPLVIFVSMSI